MHGDAQRCAARGPTARARLRRGAALLCCALLALLPGAAADDGNEAPAATAPLPPPGEMARCKALIDAGQTAQARARLLPIVEAHPEWARAALLLGLTFYRESRFEAANVFFARALAADPEEVAARPLYAWSLYSLGELERAEAMFASLLERLPDYSAAHYGLGLVHLDRDEPEAARSRFDRAAALAAAEDDAEMEGRAHARLGEVAERLGDLAAARRELERAVEIAPGDEEARFRLSALRRRLAAGGGEPARPPVAAAADTAPGPRLSPVPGAGGIDLVMTSGGMPSREILEVDGGGIALFDYDRDGDVDVFLANGATLDDPEHGPGSRLYANRGDGTFEDVTARVGVELTRWAMGVAVGDVDGDGWEDLYVTCYGPNVLLRNVGDAGGGRRFADVTAEAGVGDERWSTSAVLADLDGDEDLDLYVANYLAFDIASPPPRAGSLFKGTPVMAGPRGLEAQADALYENLGDGSFRDVSATSGIAVGTGLDYGLGVRVLDADGDRRPDLFVGNDSTADLLLRNLGDLAFEEVGVPAGLSASGSGTTQATMGIALADVDGGGLPDLLLTVFSDDTNTLHVNLGDGLFADRSARYGLGAASRPDLGWGCGFHDFDLDGDEDLFVANGHVYPEMDDPEVGASWAQRPGLFERRGARFEPVCDATWCERRYHGRATAFGDLDGDLDVDVLMTTLNGPLLRLANDAPAGSALVVRTAAPPGRARLGVRVEAETPDGTQRRWLTGGGSFQSVDQADAFFGLGEATGAAVRLRWPDGAATRIEGVPAGRLLVVPRPAP